MTDVEYEFLLDVVRTAIAPEPPNTREIGPMPHWFSTLSALPRAANDNQTCWPLIPFPDDSTAMPGTSSPTSHGCGARCRGGLAVASRAPARSPLIAFPVKASTASETWLLATRLLDPL